jgi:phosphomannomutase
VVLAGDGAVVHEDTVVAVLGEHAVRAATAAAPVVITTPNASARIDERVEAAGGRTTRVALGGLHEGIAAAHAAGDPLAFSAEPWKHLHPALGGWIDGVASAALLVRLLAHSGGLAALTEPVTERPYRKASLTCPDAVKRAAMATLGTALPERFPEASVDHQHGVRLDRPDGSWVLVRPSGTEPKIRLYAEGADVDELVRRAREAVTAAVTAAEADACENG